MIRILLSLAALLALAAPASASWSFTFTAADQGAVTELAVLTRFQTTLRNTGTTADTYTVTMVKDMPAAWACSFCEGQVCYPPWLTQLTINLQPGQETYIDVDLTPLADQGTGIAHVTVASQGSPALSVARAFRVVSTGVQVLLVDGDGGQQLEDYYTPALATGDVTWARWPRDEAGALSSPELDAFAAVIWYAEGMAPGLDDVDRTALAYYVQHGGMLLLAGQDLAWQAGDPASPWYTPQSAAWLQVVLGASHAGAATGAIGVAALPGAPFGTSFTGTLNGAGGAGNSTSPDALQAVGSGVAAHTYLGGPSAAVASTWGAGRSLFCGYALESLAAGERALLLDAFLDWALGRPSAVPDGRLPLAWAVRAAPNPFNPSTTLRFEVASPGPVRVEICDLRGRVVRALADRVMAAGPAQLPWDGRDDRGATLPSGIYLARLTAGDATGATKLVLAK
ncbi:MAG: T9SS type A sorting domain-containing protein [bacterium]|nr:T9SS type A sorting domain-containing protein [bacterium]